MSSGSLPTFKGGACARSRISFRCASAQPELKWPIIRADGKIRVVGVIVIIFVGLLVYMIRLDRKAEWKRRTPVMSRNHLIALVLIAVSIGAIFYTGRRKYLCHLRRGRGRSRTSVHGHWHTRYSRGMHYAARKTSSLYALDKNGMSRRYCTLNPNHRFRARRRSDHEGLQQEVIFMRRRY